MSVATRFLAALGALLLLTSPGFAPIGARTIERGITARPALWVMKDADTTIYLFGTIHVLKPGVRWFEGPVKAAFDGSDALMMEIDAADQASIARKTAALALDPDGPPLSQKLDGPSRTKYRALLARLGIDPATLEPFQPWFAAVTLSIVPLEKLGYRPDLGAEDVLAKAAAAAGKPVGALETVDAQLGFFAALPEPTQIAFLAATVDDALAADREMARMIGNWARGKPDALARDMNDSLKAMPDVADALLTRRNRRWAKALAERMNAPGTLFVAVGAGHLAGKDSLLADLKAAGFAISRVE